MATCLINGQQYEKDTEIGLLTSSLWRRWRQRFELGWSPRCRATTPAWTLQQQIQVDNNNSQNLYFSLQQKQKSARIQCCRLRPKKVNHLGQLSSGRFTRLGQPVNPGSGRPRREELLPALVQWIGFGGKPSWKLHRDRVQLYDYRRYHFKF